MSASRGHGWQKVDPSASGAYAVDSWWRKSGDSTMRHSLVDGFVGIIGPLDVRWSSFVPFDGMSLLLEFLA